MSMAARQVRSLAQVLRLSSPPTHCVSHRVSHLNPSRGFSSEHHGPPKVNFWEDPMSPSKWKEEHFVLISLAGWGTLIYGSYKFFTGGKKDKTDENINIPRFLMLVLGRVMVPADRILQWLSSGVPRLDASKTCTYIIRKA